MRDYFFQLKDISRDYKMLARAGQNKTTKILNFNKMAREMFKAKGRSRDLFRVARKMVRNKEGSVSFKKPDFTQTERRHSE